jgi:hypothetical protein
MLLLLAAVTFDPLKWVRVKCPFDNKSEFRSSDMPDGTPLEQTTRWRRHWDVSRPAARGYYQIYATSGPLLQRPRAPLLLAHVQSGDIQVNLSRGTIARHRATRLHDDAAGLDGLPALRCAHQGSRSPAGPPVLQTLVADPWARLQGQIELAAQKEGLSANAGS